MKSKICLVAPHKDIANAVRDVIQEQGEALLCDITIVEGDMENGVRLSKPTVEKGVDAIISRGGTAHVLAEAYPRIPVIEIQVDALDILKTIRSIPSGKHIGFISYSNVIYQYQAMAEVLDNHPITYFHFVTQGEEPLIEHYVQEAKEAGVDILIGGAHVQTYAKRQGIKSIFLLAGKDTILKAIREEEASIQVRKKERESLKVVNDIVDHAFIGIAVFDKHAHLQKWNTTLLTFFPQLVSKNTEQVKEALYDIFSGSQLLAVLKRQSPDLGEILHIEKQSYALRWHRIIEKGRIVGAIAFLQEANQLQSYVRSVRRKLQEKGLVAQYTIDDIIGNSLAVRKVKKEAEKYAATSSTVLITGESGTGKEMMAQAIHNLSKRRKGPFVAINCSAFTESLLESELFGYEDGAFTGGIRGGKAGVFELADGGTLFLDEIGDMPYILQNRLLRVLQEHVVMRVGGSKVIPVDVRIIAATNQDLKQAIEANQFRLDLFFRLDVLRIRMPALRERTSDIPLLANIFLVKMNQRYKTKKSFAPDVLRYLAQLPWIGNVRQLRNIVERVVLMTEGYTITLNQIRQVTADDITESVNDEERQNQIERLLQEGKNYSEIARILGVSRSTLWRMRKRSN